VQQAHEARLMRHAQARRQGGGEVAERGEEAAGDAK